MRQRRSQELHRATANPHIGLSTINDDGPARLGLPRELFTIDQVAVILGMSERTVETLVAQGHLRSAIAPGTNRSRRVSRAMLAEYIDRFNGSRA